MQIRTILLLLTLLFNSIYSQDLYKLLKDYIPAGHEKYFSPESVNEQLYADGKLNPSLIYWRIKFYVNIIDKNNVNNQTNGFNHLRNLTNIEYKKRNEFIHIQLDKLAAKSENLDFESKISDVLKEKLRNEETQQDTRIKESTYSSDEKDSYSENLDFYFRIVFLTLDGNLKYNPSVNYVELFEETKISKIKNLELEWANLPNTVNLDFEIIENTLNLWYILIKEDVDSLFEIPQFFNNYFAELYSTKNLNNHSIGLGYTNYFINKANEFSITNFQGTDAEFGNFSSQFHYAFSIHYSHTFIINESKKSFSNLRIALQNSFANGNPGETENIYATNYFDSTGNKYKMENIFISNINITSSIANTISLALSTPLLYLGPDFSIDIGLTNNLTIYIIKGNYDCQTRVREITEDDIIGMSIRNISESSEENLVFDDLTTIFSLSPLVSLNYNILKNIQMQFVSYYDSFSINCFYTF